jgi:hypothetical protein
VVTNSNINFTIYAYSLTLTYKGEHKSIDSRLIEDIEIPETYEDAELNIRNQFYKGQFMSPVGKLDVWVGYSSLPMEEMKVEGNPDFILYNITLKKYYDLGKKKELKVPEDINFANS